MAQKKSNRAKCRWDPPQAWSEWNAFLSSGLHGRNRWRLGVLLVGMLFAGGRRTVTSWLRAAGVSDDYQDYYYFLECVGRKCKSIASQLLVLVLKTIPLPQRLLLVIDDSPTKRYGPKVEGADVHHNPTPGPAGQPFLYGHVWVTISLAVRHTQWGSLALPLRAMLYVRKQTMATIPPQRRWHAFATKLVLAARLVEWAVPLLKQAGKTAWVVVDGGYTKKPFLKRVLRLKDAVVVGRLRKDAALRDVPTPPKRRTRGRPRIYGKHRLSLAKRAGQTRGWSEIDCEVYGTTSTKAYKTFLATYKPAGGVIRVVLIKEDHGWYAFYCTDPSTSVREIVEAFADRATIEQDFHDVKEVWGSGEQQVRNIWNNLAVYNLNLWVHTLVELWAWDRRGSTLVNRSDSPWDDPHRRPSHANRRKALRTLILQNEFSAITADWSLPRKILRLAKNLMNLAA
jgi:hypothetical protein